MSDFYDDPAFSEARIPFLKRRQVGDALSDTFDFLRHSGREYAVGIIVLVLPIVVLNLVVSVVSGAQAQSMEMLTAMLSGELDPEALGAGPSLGLVALSSVLGLIVFVLMQAATLAYLQRYRNGEAGAIPPGVLWEATKPLLLPVGGVMIATTALVTVLVFANILPCLGQIAFLGGLLFLGPIMWMWPVARVFDAEGLGSAFRRTRTLMKGHWGASLLTVILIMIVVFVLVTLVSVPAIVLAFALGDLMGNVVAVLSGALGLLLYPIYGLPIITATLHYFNLVERSEAVDLKRRVDDLDDLDPPADPEGW
ncbi:MAG: hypothetical protein AAGN64_05660 [Bacteroidota bacterium]